MAHIEWNEVALDEGVRALAALVRRRFGLWVGIATADGSSFPLAGEERAGGPRLCQPVSANPSNSDVALGCRGSIRAWANEVEIPSIVRCHAGLSSFVTPLPTDTAAAIYFSGFFEGDAAFRQGELLRQELGELDVDPETIDQMVGEVPHIDRTQRDVLKVLGDEIAERVAVAVESAHIDDSESFEEMIGRSDEMVALFDTLRRVSRSNSTILIEGENGTGKELIARAVHRRSRRSDRPFIVQNCAAIPSDLIESELFGHRKGAFSGAHRDREGLFSAADGGTFFLDEIGDMDVSLQVKLLRILQEGTFLPVGGSTFRKVDVRIVCATNRDLEKLVEQGGFRQDLYFRIKVINIVAPPLRHRRDDIPLLARHFAAKASRIHGRPRKRLQEDALEALERHTWPGNVRELENEVERAVIMSGDRESLAASDFELRPPPRASGFEDLSRSNVELPAAIEELERTMILEGLRRTGWNKTQTARELGVSRRNLIRKVAAYELEEHRSS